MEMPRWYDGWKTTPPDENESSEVRDPLEGLDRIGFFHNRGIWCDALIEKTINTTLSDFPDYARDWMLEACAEHARLDIDLGCYIIEDSDLPNVFSRFEEIAGEEL